MIALDSSAWLAIFQREKNEKVFLDAVSHADEVCVPAPCFYEVYRRLRHSTGAEEVATNAVMSMAWYGSAPLDCDTASFAARIPDAGALSACDRFIYAIAQQQDATLWTQDKHFALLPGVQYVG